MNNEQDEIQIDLVALLLHLRKKLWIIVAATLVCAVVGFAVSQFLMTPQYTASTRMYVLNRSSDSTVVSSDFQISNYMVSDYQELIVGRNVTSAVIEQLNLDLTDAQLKSKITVSSPSNTRFIQIDVEDADPQMAAKIADSVREQASSQLTSIMMVDAVTTVYEAEVPVKPTSPNVTRNALLGGLVGMVIAVGIFSVLFIMDDHIRNEDDVERYLGLSTIGVIPVMKELNAPSKAAREPKKTGKPAPKAPKAEKPAATDKK